MQRTRFSFGENWQDFVAFYLTPERIAIARQHLAEFLEMPNLQEKSFLDIGCGSGLSSLAACELGAASIVSFDLDPAAVSTTQKLRDMAGNPAHWQVLQGSILDEAFINTLACADIVYSWGVLHHTGHLWQAVENASRLLTAEGLFDIALYTTTSQSQRWLRLKQRYNRASLLGKRWMEITYMGRQLTKLCLLRFQNPIRHVRQYKRTRGMAYLTDVRDWLGGYPYEDARIEDVLRFARKHLGLELINIRTGEANTEYLFQPQHRLAT